MLLTWTQESTTESPCQAAHTLLEIALLLHWLHVMTQGPEDHGGTISVAVRHQDSLRYDYTA